MAKKTKKVKKVLGVPVDVDLGKKVKDINLDKDKYKLSNMLALIFLNLVLIGTIAYLLSVMNNILLTIISIFTVIVCLIWSILSYKKGVINIKYTIYENAVVKDFYDSKNVGLLNKLVGFKICKTFLDKLGNHKTKTLVLKFDNTWCSKIVFTCINEDIDLIIDTIHNLRLKNKSKIAIINKDNTPLIKKMISLKLNNPKTKSNK